MLEEEGVDGFQTGVSNTLNGPTETDQDCIMEFRERLAEQMWKATAGI